MMPEIVEVFGHAAAARLSLALGGREVRIPARHQGRTWDALVQAIGAEAAARFCDYFQGERLYIASSQRLRTEFNRRRAAEMRAQGRSWCEIAQELGYSERGYIAPQRGHSGGISGGMPESLRKLYPMKSTT
jgi:hypothetical protein